MNPEQLVVSFKLAKRLKKLKIPQGDCYFAWEPIMNPATEVKALLTPTNSSGFRRSLLIYNFEWYAAPTLTELLMLMPGLIYIPPINYDLFFTKGNRNGTTKYQWGYEGFGEEHVKPEEPILVIFSNTNPAESAGELLCWLVKQGHVKWGEK